MKTGYYWVQEKEKGEWEVVHYHEDEVFLRVGSDNGWFEKDFHKIGGRVQTKELKSKIKSGFRLMAIVMMIVAIIIGIRKQYILEGNLRKTMDLYEESQYRTFETNKGILKVVEEFVHYTKCTEDTCYLYKQRK